ncbi:MAG: potassium transporter TrkG [Pseudomonadota bacterium]
MANSAILKSFGATLVVLAGLMAMVSAASLLWPDETAEAYLYGAAIAGFAGAALLLIAESGRTETDFRTAIFFVLFWWTGVPIFACAPFLFSGIEPVGAYFEAVSALTTTGAWLAPDELLESPLGALWRAALQWLGGLASLAVAAAIFIRPAFIGIETLSPPFSSGDNDSALAAVRAATEAFIGVYGGLTALCFLLLTATGVPGLEALITAMSTLSSGGFLPALEAGGADAANSVNRATAFILTPFLFLSGANFILITRLATAGSMREKDIETRAYAAAILIVACVYWLALGAGDMRKIADQIFNATSLFSTTGVTIGEAPTLPFVLVTIIIGGAAVSTAGGFKILRWLVIIRRAREEVRRLVIPNGVFGGRQVAEELGVWIHFLVFTLTLGVLTLALTLGGHPFELSATVATAMLANAGPVVFLVEGAPGGYGAFSPPLQAVMCVAMVLGRLEAVVALALFNNAFWRS